MFSKPLVVRIAKTLGLTVGGIAVLTGCVFLEPFAGVRWGGRSGETVVAMEMGECRTLELAAAAAKAWSETFSQVSSAQVLAAGSKDYPYVFFVLGQRDAALTYLGPDGKTLGPDEEWIAEFPLRNGAIRRWRRNAADVGSLVVLIKAQSTGAEAADLSNVKRLLDESFWLEGDSSGARAACTTGCSIQSCPRVVDVAGAMYFDCTRTAVSCRESPDAKPAEE